MTLVACAPGMGVGKACFAADSFALRSSGRDGRCETAEAVATVPMRPELGCNAPRSQRYYHPLG